MKAAYLTNRGFSIEEREKPSCAPDEVLVRLDTCGVCEGDLQTYRRLRASAGGDGVLLGHEGSGTVEQVGSAVEGIAVGDNVTALGGAYADYFAVKADRVVKLPPEITPREAYGEPLACCVHGAWRSGVRIGDRVAVVGCGFMGLVWLQLLSLQGATELCAFDPLDWRLAGSRKFGATDTRHPDAVQDDEFDVVVEAAGTEEALELSSRLVRQHGRLIIMAYHQSNDGYRRVPMKSWNYKALDIVNAHVRRNDEKLRAMEAAVRLLSAGRLRIHELVRTYRLGQIEDAFTDLISRKEGVYKIGISPGGHD